MTRRLLTLVVVIAAGIAAQADSRVSADQTQTPARDVILPAASAPTGAATFSGVIMTDEVNSRPVRRAIVTLNAPDIRVGRTAITDDNGRFTFVSLPAGRFSLVAAKAGYITTYYRSKRPGRAPAVPIPLADGQQLTNIAMKMPRGGVITGRVLDQNGRPIFVSLVASMIQTINGERTVSQQFTKYSYTDERGIFRVFGLVPGDYVLSAIMPRIGSGGSDVRAMSAAEIQRAEIAIREARAGAPPPPTPATPPQPADAPMMGYAPIYFPDTPEFASATPITIGPGEERTDVDIRLTMAPMAKVEGVVLLPDGRPAGGATVNLVSLGPQGANSTGAISNATTGAFSIASVAPGSYTLMARAGRPAATPSAAPTSTSSTAAATTVPPTWALMDLTLDGRNMRDIVLTLQAGVSLSGRIVLEPGAAAAPAFSSLRVNLEAVQPGSGATFGVVPATPDDTGAFTLTGITPGNYKMGATSAAGGPKSLWTMKSAIIGGRDASDLPVEIRDNTADAIAILTDRTTELSGQLQDASGAPTPEYSLVVFSADKRYWTRNSRRLRGPIRPGADGRFSVNDLPPGDYFLAAVTDVDASELNDTGLLEQLAAAAVKITLGEGEKKIQNIKIG